MVRLRVLMLSRVLPQRLLPGVMLLPRLPVRWGRLPQPAEAPLVSGRVVLLWLPRSLVCHLPSRSGEAASLPPFLGDALRNQAVHAVTPQAPGCYDSDTESPYREGKSLCGPCAAP
jgi:hypothetical protein